MTAYLQTWTDGAQAALDREGELLDTQPPTQYPRIGLQVGDFLYVGFLEDGYLHLIGRMRVAEIIDRACAVERRPSRPLGQQLVRDPRGGPSLRTGAEV